MANRWLVAAFVALGTLLLAVIASVGYACCPLPSLDVSPREGEAGSHVTVSGIEFGDSPVEIRWNTANGPVLATTTGPRFDIPIRIPSDARPGVYYIVGVKTVPGACGSQATSAFSVTAPPSTQGPPPTSSPPETTTPPTTTSTTTITATTVVAATSPTTNVPNPEVRDSAVSVTTKPIPTTNPAPSTRATTTVETAVAPSSLSDSVAPPGEQIPAATTIGPVEAVQVAAGKGSTESTGRRLFAIFGLLLGGGLALGGVALGRRTRGAPPRPRSDS